MNKLSRTSDVSLPVVRNIWRNPEYDVKLSTLQRLAIALDVPICDLIIDEREIHNMTL